MCYQLSFQQKKAKPNQNNNKKPTNVSQECLLKKKELRSECFGCTDAITALKIFIINNLIYFSDNLE